VFTKGRVGSPIYSSFSTSSSNKKEKPYYLPLNLAI